MNSGFVPHLHSVWFYYFVFHKHIELFVEIGSWKPAFLLMIEILT